MAQAQLANLMTQNEEVGTSIHQNADQYVSFYVGDAICAVDIMSVREIKGWSDVTRLPHQPEYVRGVLNLRGAVLPIIDLNCLLGEGLTKTTQRHVIVIVAVEDRQVGFIVDAVSDILSIAQEDIKPVPETQARKHTEMFLGFFTEAEQMVALLNLKNLLAEQPDEDLVEAALEA